jgi:Tol biopolymer transport system component
VFLHQAAPGEQHVADQTLVEDVASGKQHALALTLEVPRWSPDGRTIVGHTATPSVIATCPATGGACQRLGEGRVGVWSPDGTRIYMLRDTSNPSVKELWSMRPDGADQRKIFDRMGSFRAIDVSFDVSPKGEIVWSDYEEGRHELWQAILRR